MLPPEATSTLPMLLVSSFGWLASRAHMFSGETCQSSRYGGNVGTLRVTVTNPCWYTEHSLPLASHGLNRKESRATGAESQSVDLSLLSFTRSLFWLHVCNSTLVFVAPWSTLINRIRTEYSKSIISLFPFVEVETWLSIQSTLFLISLFISIFSGIQKQCRCYKRCVAKKWMSAPSCSDKPPEEQGEEAGSVS